MGCTVRRNRGRNQRTDSLRLPTAASGDWNGSKARLRRRARAAADHHSDPRRDLGGVVSRLSGIASFWYPLNGVALSTGGRDRVPVISGLVVGVARTVAPLMGSGIRLTMSHV